MSGTIIHIAGRPIQVDTRLRQRCSWCGALLEDVELSQIMVAADSSVEVEIRAAGTAYPTWPVGGYVAKDGNATYVVSVEAGQPAPPSSCVYIDDDVTC